MARPHGCRDVRIPGRGCAGATDAAYREVLIERFQLDTRKKIRALSKGNRQKVQLIAAFATRADLLILDEPTSGLDPLMEMAFRETVNEAKERGQTVFLSSHILSEVEALCDRVGILRDGRLVDEGTLAELRHLAAQTVEVTFAGPAAGAAGARRASHVAPAGEQALRCEVTGGVGPLIAALAGTPGGRADEPRAVARGDLHPPLRRAAARAASAIARRALADARARRTIGFALLFAVSSAPRRSSATARTYPTQADRIAFARTFGDNGAIRLFYGVPHDLLTVGGYAGWRVGGFMSLFAAVWGVLAAVRALRTEEDTGRRELVLAAPVSRRSVRRRLARRDRARRRASSGSRRSPALAGARLPVGGSAYLALAVISPVPVFAGVGALASQIAPNRRVALGLSFALLAVAFAVRVIADTVVRPRLAALGDAARLGRGAAAVRASRPRRAAAARVQPRCCCSLPVVAHRGAQGRGRRADPASETAPRRASALLCVARPPGAAQRARGALGLGRRRRRAGADHGRDLAQLLRGPLGDAPAAARASSAAAR